MSLALESSKAVVSPHPISETYPFPEYPGFILDFSSMCFEDFSSSTISSISTDATIYFVVTSATENGEPKDFPCLDD